VLAQPLAVSKRAGLKYAANFSCDSSERFIRQDARFGVSETMRNRLRFVDERYEGSRLTRAKRFGPIAFLRPRHGPAIDSIQCVERSEEVFETAVVTLLQQSNAAIHPFRPFPPLFVQKLISHLAHQLVQMGKVVIHIA
jgi:hypothetical protein